MLSSKIIHICFKTGTSVSQFPVIKKITFTVKTEIFKLKHICADKSMRTGHYVKFLDSCSVKLCKTSFYALKYI